jgi:ABC-2 type transport system ATP-binding protein
MSAETESDPPAIRAGALVVERGGKVVLKWLDFEVPAGQITGLFGPSGSGKTTLMRSIVGVQIVRSGSIEVLGQAAGSAALRQQVGYVTQAPSVYGDLTVRENLRYFARVLRVPESRIDDVVEVVALGEHIDQLVRNTSGGQRSRVSLATALLGDPQLLVLDEPTTGLDPVLRRDLWETFADLVATGTTLLVSSHVLDEAGHCQRLLLMREGRLIATETPDGLRARTGRQGLEDSFLALIEQEQGGET